MAAKQLDPYGNPLDPEQPLDDSTGTENNPPGMGNSGYTPAPVTPAPVSTTGGNPAPPVVAPTTPAPPTSQTQTVTAPTGGSLTDPSYVDSLVKYWGSQPGADPSLLADPTYWSKKILSGEFGTDQNYVINKMQTAWKGGAGGGSGQPDESGLDSMLAGLFGGKSPSAYNSSIHQNILDQIDQAKQPVDMNSHEIADPIAAYTASAQAARRQAQEASAERGYSEGDTSGALDARTSAGFEGMGRATAGFAGNTVANAYAAHRATLQNLLNTGAGVLSADETRQVQAEIAALDGELRKLGLNNQNGQFYDQLTSNMGSNANALDNAFTRLFG